jgi:hypothetical protein
MYAQFEFGMRAKPEHINGLMNAGLNLLAVLSLLALLVQKYKY